MDVVRDETLEDGTEPETDNRAVDLSNPDTVHRATMDSTIQEVGLVLTLMCSCGVELASSPGKMEYQTIHTALYQHGMEVMSARLARTLGPLMNLFKDL